jgi:hypothetical protein
MSERTVRRLGNPAEMRLPLRSQDRPRLNARFANAHYNLGLALVQRGEWDSGLLEFRTALRLKPGLLEARNQCSRILLQKGTMTVVLKRASKPSSTGPI